MSTVFVVFPPDGGGNHLKNIIDFIVYGTDISSLYQNRNKTVHAIPGRNLQQEQIEQAMLHQDQTHVLHGHFGEIMSFQSQVRSIVDKKIIILSPDTSEDQQLLNKRRKVLGSVKSNGNYWDGEQVFLYEPFMYHWYFQIPMNDIMNISISEWFDPNIDSVLDRISYFLQLPVNKEHIANLHNVWVNTNI